MQTKKKVAYGRIVEEAVIAVTACGRKSLRRVINGTGVVLPYKSGESPSEQSGHRGDLRSGRQLFYARI